MSIKQTPPQLHDKLIVTDESGEPTTASILAEISAITQEPLSGDQYRGVDVDIQGLLFDLATAPEADQTALKGIKKVHRANRPFAKDSLKATLRIIGELSGEDSPEAKALVARAETVGLVVNLSPTEVAREGIKAGLTKNREKQSGIDKNSIDQGHKQVFESLIEKFSDRSQRPSAIRGLASAYLDIYMPSKERLNNKTSSNRIKDITTQHMYSHSLLNAVSSLDPIQQTTVLDDIEAQIFQEILKKAPEANLPQLLARKDAGTERDLPELKMFTGMCKGARLELLSYNAMKQNLEKLGLTNVQPSSIEEDLLAGFDLKAVNRRSEQVFIDIKSRGSFERQKSKSFNRPPTRLKSASRFSTVKRVANDKLDHLPKEIEVIVIDAESAGEVGYVRNRYTMANPARFLETVSNFINNNY